MAQRNPTCSKCKATSSLMWHKTSNGAIVCLECQTIEKKANSSSPQSTRSTSVVSDTTSSVHSDKNSLVQSPGPTTRRSTRSRERANKAKQQAQHDNSNSVTLSNNNTSKEPANTTSNSMPIAQMSNSIKDSKSEKTSATKDKDSALPIGSATLRDHHINQWQRGRRSLSLKLFQPAKSPLAQPNMVTSDSINHNGTKYEVGDIVSMLDEEGGVYYALVRGFLQDHHAEKYAVITWLLPTYPNPTHFDPTRFILGPEEDSPKSLDVLDFVCHSPQSKNFQASYFHNIYQASRWSHTK